MTASQTAGAPKGRRERHKQQAKQRLFDCALALFAEQGYENTTIDQIAEDADVARGTFFNYFQRKEDLVSWWGEKRRTRLREDMAFAKEQGPNGSGSAAEITAKLERCMSILGRINEEEWRSTGPMLMAWVKAGRPMYEEPYAAEIFADIIQMGLADASIRTDVDPQRVGNLLRDAYLGTLYRWIPYEELPGSLPEELIASLRIVLNGIIEESDKSDV